MTTRRRFLQTLAGAAIATPLLPSLLPTRAWAAGEAPRRFVSFASDHGAIWQPYMCPPDDILTETATYAGHEIRRGDLVLETRDGRASLSPVLSASASKLTPGLVRKMIVARGFDVPFYMGHNNGTHLGNFLPDDDPRATIDQFLAYSDSFYPDTSTIVERALTLGSGGTSLGYTNPALKDAGGYSGVPGETNSLNLFRRIFRPSEEDPRRPVVDLVFEDYDSLRNSNRRISAADKRRLDAHMERLLELERKLEATGGLACNDVEEPTKSTRDIYEHSDDYYLDPSKHVEIWQLMNDVIVAAFACDTSRIATMHRTYRQTFSTYAGDWHQDIAHECWRNGDRHDVLQSSNQVFFEGVFVDLISKLDGVQAEDGGTLLDASIVQWSQESGPSTHEALEMPYVVAGGAAGALRTGQYVDVRNLGVLLRSGRDENIVPDMHTGLFANQWVATLLDALGIPRSEYERGDWGGYGATKEETAGWWIAFQKHTEAQYRAMAEPVPWILT